ncbi:astacin-like metalloprotease toxin 5 [Dermacentor andersoni]|uniref:astacin-like metalloprotease toxin 5 n=1 Tax=Dermacentor andersoni TaxID=34620 RepID=UPI002415D22F|nr:astacin-like metalloprotease toxin 5 [Dermacentor andersoni]
MSMPAVKNVALVLLATTAWRAEAAPAPEVPPSEIHAGVRAMQPGDIQEDIVMEGLHETGRTATPQSRKLWPGGVIPYTIDYALLTPEILGIIKGAMDHIEKETCLRFVRRNDHIDYVHLVSKEGCYSFLGRIGGRQPVSLGHGCLYHGTVTHELMHAVGFFHEHTRPDRDRYIEVFPKNIIKEFLPQFQKLDPEDALLLTPFDYDSVMLYGSDSFTRDPNRPSMLAKDGSRLKEVYDKNGPSSSDFRRISKLYKCR